MMLLLPGSQIGFELLIPYKRSRSGLPFQKICLRNFGKFLGKQTDVFGIEVFQNWQTMKLFSQQFFRK